MENDIYKEATLLVVELQRCTASLLQRRFKINYKRAAEIIEAMEKEGIVGPLMYPREREVLIKKNHGKKT